MTHELSITGGRSDKVVTQTFFFSENDLKIRIKMVLRQRRKPVAQIVTELDAFPKVPDTYVEYTLSGAYGKSIICMKPL